MKKIIEIDSTKIRVFVLIIFIILMPLLVHCLCVALELYSENNDWIGFFGSYIGSIVGAFVAMYVLFKTLRDNRELQKRTEIIEFCNLITEKKSMFAQKYEEALYEAHKYLAIHQSESPSAKEEFHMYKQFLAAHHSAKAVLYEIESYLSVRKDIDLFQTPSFEMTLHNSSMAYDEFDDFERKVGAALRSKDVDDQKTIYTIEQFLDMVAQYQKELLEKVK